MSQAPSMPLFCGDYLGDTMHLSLEEHGAYLKLLMVTWQNAGQALPDDATRLARILGITVSRWNDKLRPVIVEFFDLSGASWRHHRLEKEWNFVQERAAKSRENGSRGGRPKALETNERQNPAGSSQGTQTEPTQPQPHSSEEADASSADPRRVIFGGIATWLAKERGCSTEKAKAWLGKAAKAYGDGNLIDACARIRAGPYQNDVISAVTAECKRLTNGRQSQQAKTSAVTNIYAGAAIALARRAERQDDCGADFDAPEPLLDGGRSARGAGIANR